MDTDALRKRAQHMRELARLIADERARQAALFLAADYEHQADALDPIQNSPQMQSAPAYTTRRCDRLSNAGSGSW